MIQQKNKCIFLDRDGVLNFDRSDYTFRIEDFIILPGVNEALIQLKNAGFILIVITNQAGIAKGLYTSNDVKNCHNYLQANINYRIDAIYYSPYHPSVTESLSRKPDSLLFEKAIARFRIQPTSSWMIGDKNRDLIPAKKLGIHTLKIGKNDEPPVAELFAKDLKDASQQILKISTDH